MIEIKDLAIAYEGEEKLFSSLCLNIEENKPILILSEPGVGKTSFAKALSGSGEKFYSLNVSGSFRYGSQDLFSLDVPQRCFYVARSIQNADEAILFPTVSDEIAFPLEQRMKDRNEIKERLSTLLKRYDLLKYHDADTSELSGGEKRRLNLATLDAIAPKLFIYDEAFDELSSSWRRKLLSIIREKEYVIVLGSHYLREYDGFFSSVYELTQNGLERYEKRDVSFSFPSCCERGEKHTLKLDGILFSQSHKAMERENAFTLSVPSMTLESGKAYLLEGENGAGKSTLARLITGLVEECGGMVLYDSRRVRAKERRGLVSYLFQNPFSQLYLPTVFDELMSVLDNKEDAVRIAELFRLSLESYTQELSYGKAKMLQAAICYALERPFVIFDEVDSAISYDDTMHLLSLYLEKGAGVLMISHDDRIKASFSGLSYHIEGGTLR